MISRVAKASQSNEDDDDSPAEAQWGFFKKLLRHYKPIIGKVIRRGMRSYMIQGNRDEENAMIEAVLNSITKEQGDDYDEGDDGKAIQSNEDDDDSPAEAQWGFFKRWVHKFHRNRLLKKLAGKALRGIVRSYMSPQQGNGGEENVLIEAALNSKLESLAREQGDDDDDGDDARASQSDEDDDNTLAEAQWGLFRKIFHHYKPVIRKWVKKVISRVNNGNGLIQDDDDDSSDDDGMTEAKNDAVVQAFLEKLMERDTNVMAAIESLPEEAQAQFLFAI